MSDTQITEAAANLFQTWGPDLAKEVAPTFNCGEIEALADLYRAGGNVGMADYWIEAHSIGDEPGDAHYVPGPATS